MMKGDMAEYMRLAQERSTADDATDRDVIAWRYGRGRCSCTGILYKTGQASWT